MAKGLIPGTTNYLHQGIGDIVEDLEKWRELLTDSLNLLLSSKSRLKQNNYWQNSVSFDFRSVTARSVHFYGTCLDEINEVIVATKSEIEVHHVKRLARIGETAWELNHRFGDVWHRGGQKKEYEEPNFKLLEKMYIEGRQMALDLLDVGNVAERLNDFVGRKVALQEFEPINMAQVNRAMWVLEGDYLQGTAFYLKDIGYVTCEHVLGDNMFAFRAAEPTRKYPIEVVKANSTIDLAIIKIKHTSSMDNFVAGTANDLRQMDPVVVTGYPNYRTGDTGVIHRGSVSGFRTVSGIRRILLDIPIVSGISGGPVFNQKHYIIGVAVTGADRMENAYDTENHGVIPIDALEHLR